MLHEFIQRHRQELIALCKAKVGKRSSLPPFKDIEHGVPQFLDLLERALKAQSARVGSHLEIVGSMPVTAASEEGNRRAALHGKELLELGYTFDQVVHGYGDICQSITELASHKRAPITVAEFHSLNQMLDNAIAEAVSSYGYHRENAIAAQGVQDLHDQLGAFADRQRVVIDKARKAFTALTVGYIGPTGATGKLLELCLEELQELVDKTLPEIRLASGMTQAPEDLKRRAKD